MAEVVGVVFSGGLKVYHFDPAGLELAAGERVVVQTSSGPEIGEVVEPPHSIDDAELPAALKRVQRIATAKDLEAQASSESTRREAMIACRESIRDHGLDMKLVGAEMGFGGEKITFNFFSEERIDFRALVADLSKKLKMRVELRQVGARDEARMVGGLGPCGRGLCCASFPGDDDPVSIRMAKEQNLPLNPSKISGLCGRLMCCLKYEQEQYVCFRKESPAKGTRVVAPSGEGVVSGYLVTKEAIVVRMEDGSQAEIPLRTCEPQKDGSLLVIPEEKPAPPAPWMELPMSLGRSTREDPAQVSTGVGAGDSSTDAQSGTGAATEAPRSSRSRKSRGRRRGRGRGQGQNQGQGQSSGDAGAAGAVGRPGEKRDAAGEKTGGGQKPAGQRESGGSRAPRSNRRRRPRRPSGSAGGGSGSGAGAAGGGASD